MKKSIVIYQSWATILESLSDAKAGQLIKMIVKYGIKGEVESSEDESINAIFEMVREKIDEDIGKYNAKVDRVKKINEDKKNNRDDNVTKSSRNRNDNASVTVTDTVLLSKDNNVKGRFIPPTISDVISYMLECGINDSKEAEKFVNFYASKGWYVGKNKMKDWKAAVRNWIIDIKKPVIKKNGFNVFEGQREYNYDDIEKVLVAN